MLGHFGSDPAFWESLPARAESLGLHRPLYSALRYCNRLLAATIPADTLTRVEQVAAPSRAARELMDQLVERVLRPGIPGEDSAPLAAWLLYVRSHWLRMPPWLLATHVSKKALRRLRARLT